MKKAKLTTLLLLTLTLGACGGGNSNNPSGGGDSFDPDSMTEEEKATYVENLVTSAVAAKGSVKTANYRCWQDFKMGDPDVTTVTWEYGVNDGKASAHYEESSTYFTKNHYGIIDDNGAVMAYEVDSEGNVNPDENFDVNGYNLIMTGSFKPTDDTELVGMESLMKVIYEWAVLDVNNDAIVELTGETTFEVAYNTTYYSWGWPYRVTNIASFEFDKTTHALIGAETNMKMYDDSDLDINEETDTFTIKPGTSASVENVVQYTATVGTRTAINLPHDPDTFYFTSFDLYYKGELVNDGDVLDGEIEFGAVYVEMRNALPETASVDFDKCVITIDGVESENSFFNRSEEKFGIAALTDGTHLITITSTKGVRKTFSIKNEFEAASEIFFQSVVTDEEWGYTYLDEVPTEVAVGDTVTLIVNTFDQYVSTAATVTYSDGSMTYNMESTGVYEDWSGDIPSYTFQANAAGTYTFSAVLVKDTTVTATCTIVVK